MTKNCLNSESGFGSSTGIITALVDDSTMTLRIPGRSNRHRVVGMSERRVVVVRKFLFLCPTLNVWVLRSRTIPMFCVPSYIFWCWLGLQSYSSHLSQCFVMFNRASFEVVFWAVRSCSFSQSARRISQNFIFKTLWQTIWIAVYLDVKIMLPMWCPGSACLWNCFCPSLPFAHIRKVANCKSRSLPLRSGGGSRGDFTSYNSRPATPQLA